MFAYSPLPFAGAASADADSVGRGYGGNQALVLRLRELEAANDGLRHQLHAQARRLQAALRALALASRSIDDRPPAPMGRAAASAPSNPVSAGTCLARGGPQPLSGRERQVLSLLTEGSRSPSIARHLGISIGTVEVHRRNIMRKVGLHTVAALTKYALREGLTTL